MHMSSVVKLPSSKDVRPPKDVNLSHVPHTSPGNSRKASQSVFKADCFISLKTSCS